MGILWLEFKADRFGNDSMIACHLREGRRQSWIESSGRFGSKKGQRAILSPLSEKGVATFFFNHRTVTYPSGRIGRPYIPSGSSEAGPILISSVQ
jgi:hypothetical protein